MKKICVAVVVACLVWLCHPHEEAYAACTAPCTKSQITTDINANWPDNTNGQITPALLRSTVLELVNSYMDTNGAISVTCPTNQWLAAIATLSSYTCTQPGFTNLSGSVLASQFPALTGDVTNTAGSLATTVGRINGVAPPNSGIWKGNGTGGATAAVSGTDYAPATSGSSILKGNGAGGFANAASGTDYAPATSGSALLLGNGSGGFSSYAGVTGVAHQWISALSAAGVATQSQPACGDLSNAAASCSTDTTNAANITSGTLPAARLGGLSAITNSLAANVSLNSTTTFFDGPSIAQGTTGTWWVSGTVTVTDTAVAGISCKLWDGTTVIDSGAATIPAASANVTISLSGYLASPAGNIKISCKDGTTVNGLITSNGSGAGKDSTVSAHRIN